jgi:hypothetical protein
MGPARRRLRNRATGKSLALRAVVLVALVTVTVAMLLLPLALAVVLPVAFLLVLALRALLVLGLLRGFLLVAVGLGRRWRRRRRRRRWRRRRWWRCQDDRGRHRSLGPLGRLGVPGGPQCLTRDRSGRSGARTGRRGEGRDRRLRAGHRGRRRKLARRPPRHDPGRGQGGGTHYDPLAARSERQGSRRRIIAADDQCRQRDGSGEGRSGERRNSDDR